MVQGRIKTAWGSTHMVGWAPHEKVREGANWEVWKRANDSFVGFAFDGERTQINTGSAAAFERIVKWASDLAAPIEKEKAFFIVDSAPKNVSVFIDGFDTGQKTRTGKLEVSPVYHTIKVSGPDVEDAIMRKRAFEGRTVEVFFTLKSVEKPPPPPPPPPPEEKREISFVDLVRRLVRGESLKDIIEAFLMPRVSAGEVSPEIAEATALAFSGYSKGVMGSTELLQAIGIYEEELAKGIDNALERAGIPSVIDLGPAKLGVGGTLIFAAALITPGPEEAPVIAAAVERMGTRLLPKVADDVIALGRGAPDDLARQWNALSKTQRIDFHKALLGLGAKGRNASDTIFRVVGPRLQATGVKGLMQQAAALWKPIALVGAFVVLKETVSWFHKELPEMVAFPLRDLIRDRNWEEAAKVLPAYKQLVPVAQDFLRKTGFEAVLGFPLWQGYADGYQAVLESYERQIAAGMIEDAKGTMLTVSTSVDPALASIETVFLQKITPFSTNIAAGRYDMVVEKEGFTPKTVTVIIKENQDNPVVVELETLPEKIAPDAGRLQVTIFDRKTNFPLKGTLFINDRAEPFHLHTFALDVREGAYELRVQEPGYKIWEDTISIRVGELLPLKAELDKIDVPVDEAPPEEVPPEEKPPAILATGKLEISSDPEAEVWIAGSRVAEKTPTTLELTQGLYDIVLKADEYHNLKQTTIVRAGELSRLSLTLFPVEAPPLKRKLARVSVNSFPSSAKILINGVFTEKWTPDSVLLEAGEYELSIAKSGYKTWSAPLKLVEE